MNVTCHGAVAALFRRRADRSAAGAIHEAIGDSWSAAAADSCQAALSRTSRVSSVGPATERWPGIMARSVPARRSFETVLFEPERVGVLGDVAHHFGIEAVGAGCLYIDAD